MKRRLLALLGAALLTLAISSGALAAQNQPPTPGDPNCHGLAVSYLASNGAPPAQIAKALGLPNTGDFNQLIKEICTVGG